MAKMTPTERQDWIMAYVRKNKLPVSVLDQAFVDAYVEATGVSYVPTNYGSNKCPRLYGDLAALTDEYRLKRTKTGIKGMAGMGFPNSVYTYTLAFEGAV